MLNPSGSGWGNVAGSCVRSNELAGSIKCGKCHDNGELPSASEGSLRYVLLIWPFIDFLISFPEYTYSVLIKSKASALYTYHVLHIDIPNE